LDDFARRFFAAPGRSGPVSTYNLEDICEVLNSLAQSDWKAFLSEHLRTHSTTEATAGLARAGWRLTYTAAPSESFLQRQVENGAIDFDSSAGLQVRQDGTVRSVVWEGPAFQGSQARHEDHQSERPELHANRYALSGGGLERGNCPPYAFGQWQTVEFHTPARGSTSVSGTPDRLTPLLQTR